MFIKCAVFILFFVMILPSNVKAIKCYCYPDAASGKKCVDQQCEEVDGACYVLVEARTSMDSNKLLTSYGCLEERRLRPRPRPLVCENLPNSSDRISCCFDGDFCNRNLTVPTFPPPSTLMPPTNPNSSDSTSNVIIIVAVILAVLLALSVLFLFWRLLPRIMKKKYSNYAHPTTPDPPKNLPSSSTTGVNDVTMNGWSSGSGSGQPLLVHRTIARQIHLLNEIGKGRYGEVYRGVWHGEDVAVKKFATRDEQSWFREAEIYQTSMLRHDNILGFIAADNKDVGTWTELWLVSEYHENGSLFDYLSANKVTVAEMLKLAWTIASGLAHLHMEIIGTQGKPPIAHRDLKSKNILVKKNGECAIADLGLAVRHDCSTDTIDIPFNSKVGTRRYMAPEVLNDTLNIRRFDSFVRADIYSLGLVFWEIARRCNVGNQDLDYQLPYYDSVPDDPSVEEMRVIVCDRKKRPSKEDTWCKYESMSGMAKVMEECWYENASARLTAIRTKKSIAKLQLEEGVKV